MIAVADDISVLDVISSESGLKFSVVVEIRAVETKLAKNNTDYLAVSVGDKSATCSCKIFGGSPVYNFFRVAKAGAIVLLEGISKDYNGAFSPDITSAKALTDAEIAGGNYLRRVSACADEGVDALKAELNAMISSMADGGLRATVSGVVDELGPDFYAKAAGISMHHAYKNGLLEHTVHAARAGMKLLPLYSFVDRDIALAGLLLHDVGKTLEYTNDPVAQRTRIGVLHGHLVLGYRLVRKVALQNKLNWDVLERLEHVLLSHHSDPEFGAVVRPATSEAVFVALVDNFDAKMGMVEQLLKTTPEKNVFSDFHKGLESKLLVSPIDRGGEMR
ncbi:MAG: HD domain-containing protein [Puniceicoccales bacterium]|jgi:3'-5' exoribonuclease|nr:HD domain-containing protein [Puniceicoccales bacterium]